MPWTVKMTTSWNSDAHVFGSSRRSFWAWTILQYMSSFKEKITPYVHKCFTMFVHSRSRTFLILWINIGVHAAGAGSIPLGMLLLSSRKGGRYTPEVSRDTIWKLSFDWRSFMLCLYHMLKKNRHFCVGSYFEAPKKISARYINY